MTTAQIKTVTESVDSHALRNGDLIDAHGCLFILKNRRLYNQTADHCLHDPKGFVAFDTDLIAYSDAGGMPRHWADKWTVQGNSRARWARVTNRREVAAAALAALDGKA